MIIFLIFFLIFSYFGFKIIKDVLIKIAFSVHSLSIILFFILPKFLFYANDSKYETPLVLIILVHFFLTLFLCVFNFNYSNKFHIRTNTNYKSIFIIPLFIIYYSLFFVVVFISFDNIIQLRAGSFHTNFLFFDFARYFLIALVTFNLVLIYNPNNNFIKKIIYLSLFLIGLSLILGFGSRNSLLYVLVAFLICVFINKKYKHFVYLIPFLLIFNLITSNRDNGIDIHFTNKGTSLLDKSVFVSLDNLKTLKKIYYETNLFHYSNQPLKLFSDFYLSSIPKQLWNYFGFKKNTYKTYLEWNFNNVNVGNETPSYFGQILLQNGLIGLFFFPLNFLLILIPHSLFFKKVSSYGDPIINIVLLSLFIGGVFNITRFISFAYLAPFWFSCLLILILKQNK